MPLFRVFVFSRVPYICIVQLVYYETFHQLATVYLTLWLFFWNHFFINFFIRYLSINKILQKGHSMFSFILNFGRVFDKILTNKGCKFGFFSLEALKYYVEEWHQWQNLKFKMNDKIEWPFEWLFRKSFAKKKSKIWLL